MNEFIPKYDYDCTAKCQHLDHGEKITSVLTKRSIDNNILAAYIAKLCRNFANIHDCLGRTALHMVCSVDKYSICKWLLNHGASINAKDNESGGSALHRAIFYGCIDCAVLLISNGAKLDTLDNDTCTPFKNICKMDERHLRIANYNDLLVWGSNKNYNLGIGNNDFAKAPQFIDLFRQENISITNIAISPFHSLFLDNKGYLYSVGSGAKGRLGNYSENSLAVPKRLKKINIKNSEEKIIQISVSRYHSMFLTNMGMVYVCGSNENKQLGINPPPEMLLSFCKIPFFQQGTYNIVGILAIDSYSIAYSKNELYIWGKNLEQFGFAEPTEEIILPKKIPFPDIWDIKYVEACPNAIAIATSGNIFLYYNNKLKMIKSPVLEGIKSLSLIVQDSQNDKKQSKEKTSDDLKLVLLNDTNALYIWCKDIEQYLRCSFTNYKLSVIDKVLFKKNQVIILSEGDVYLGNCKKVPISHKIRETETGWLSDFQIKKDISSDYKIRIDLTHMDGIDRAVDIFSDDNLESLGVLKEHSRKYFNLPKILSEEYNFKKLLNDVNEFDTIFDLVFYVDNEIFYGHKFIIYSRSKGLKTIIQQFDDSQIYLNYKNFTAKMFEIILKYIYSNYLITFDDIDDINHSLGPNFKENNGIKIFIEVAEKFLLTDLVLYIKSQVQSESNLKSNKTKFDKSKLRFNRLKRTNYPELHDVKIICANNEELKAHKCVLVTRLEYFNLMFTHNWSETSSINLTTIPLEYMEPIINFLYTNDIDHFKKQNYNETFLFNMIVICDQFFINNLRNVCEILALDRISIRKCGEMLEFAESYNCEILKRGCMDFICQNLGRVLYQKSLEICDPKTLNNLNKHYRKIFEKVFDFRQITPENDIINDEDLLQFVDEFNINLNYKFEENNINSIKQSKKIKTKEEKFKTDKRNYEKEAISAKLKEMNLEILNNIKKIEIESLKKETNNFLKETAEISDKLQATSNLWMKINDKKEQKKTTINTNLNNILQKEKKQKETYQNLKEILISSPSSPNTSGSTSLDNNLDISNNSNEIINHSALNFGDFFTPVKSDKLSQKQRKRLSSESSVQKTLDTSFEQVNSPSKPILIPNERPNAWGIISTPPSYNDSNISTSLSNTIKYTPEKSKAARNFEPSANTSAGSIGTSFNAQKSSTGAISKQSPNKSSQLHQILEDEKRQKEYLEQMRNKSLVLTQIEEKAIDELKNFYNVENCEDEIITIFRKPMHFNLNMPQWHKK